MEVKVDLDVTKIDYDKINEQIISKINEMDVNDIINKNWEIKSLCKDHIIQKIRNHTESELFNDYRLNEMLRTQAREDIRTEVHKRVDEYLNSLSDEDISKIVSELVPYILVDIIKESLNNSLVRGLAINNDIQITNCRNLIQQAFSSHGMPCSF